MTSRKAPGARSWIRSERVVPRLIARPLREFLETESAGGLVLLAAAAVALIWANSPFSSSYRALWATDLSIRLGPYLIAMDLRHWINDGLMAIFFFVVGLEIKREIVVGELSTPRKAALPAVAAVGGMVAPALIYLALNAGSAGSSGWGIPMATDIAFAVGVLSLLGGRINASLKIFLLSLAIADDIGAILVIGLFYSKGIALDALGVAGVVVLTIVGLRRVRVTWIPLYVALGAGLWLAMLHSGIHPTIAGIALGVLAPARPLVRTRDEESVHLDARGDGVTAEKVTAFKLRAHERVAVTERLQHALHPWTGFVIIPLFALANAGVSLGIDGRDVSWAVTVGVIAGLVVGKPLGITLFAWAGARLGLLERPAGVSWPEIVGVAALAGIGFTISLFIAGLAFDDPALIDAAKIGILGGSLLASLLGAWILLRRATGDD